jgi:plastocyanin
MGKDGNRDRKETGMRRRSIGVLSALGLAIAAALVAAPAVSAATVATPADGVPTYRVQIDAQPPTGEPWAFLKFFPGNIVVHQGDVIDANWGGVDTPHTATFIRTTDPETWRQEHQGPGGKFAPFEPDAAVGGDDDELVGNPNVFFPSDFSCGGPSNPCSFTRRRVSSGVQFPNPSAQPSFFVKLDADPGRYTLLCLLHPLMEIPVKVVPAGTLIPSPAQVETRIPRQIARVTAQDGSAADAQAQQVDVKDLSGGRKLYKIQAGGYAANVTANEYLDAGLSLHVGDRVQVRGNFEIHTATFPASSASSVPFIVTQCEVPGPDIPANSPADCADPSQFQIALTNQAILPTAGNGLSKPSKFVNSGLLADPSQSFRFLAQKPGTYTLVCLVHGPEMSATIEVSP